MKYQKNSLLSFSLYKFISIIPLNEGIYSILSRCKILTVFQRKNLCKLYQNSHIFKSITCSSGILSKTFNLLDNIKTFRLVIY